VIGGHTAAAVFAIFAPAMPQDTVSALGAMRAWADEQLAAFALQGLLPRMSAEES
jgi:hypothetical protein